MEVSMPDMLTRQEILPLKLGEIYRSQGYKKYRMSRFEEYSLYRENEGFLPSRQLMTFTDIDGRLMALKPDVTLSIAKDAQPGLNECKKYYYSENVYRPDRSGSAFREISQMGLECIGNVDIAAMAQVINLSLLSLKLLETFGKKAVLSIGHMGFAVGVLEHYESDAAKRKKLLDCLKNKQKHEIMSLSAPEQVGVFLKLLKLNGNFSDTLIKAKELICNEKTNTAWQELFELQKLIEADADIDITLDLSLVNELDYYNGLVFCGYLNGLVSAVLRGGRYDPLAQRFTPNTRAIGFAMYLNELERLSVSEAQKSEREDFISIALPKGRLGEKVYKLLQASGYGCEEDFLNTRKLVAENKKARVRYFWVKPSDVPIYVEHGAVDIGIVGKDTLDESKADVYELLDTGLGKCDMCVAGTDDYIDDTSRTLKVATKFPNIAKRYYAMQVRDIEIIKLNGSIELAPLVGLSDVIVDIVETGTTLRENGLHVLQKFLPISARVIANKSSYQFKKNRIDALTENFSEETAK